MIQQLVEEQEIVPLDPYCVFNGKRATLRISEGSVLVGQSAQASSAQTLLEGTFDEPLDVLDVYYSHRAMSIAAHARL